MIDEKFYCERIKVINDIDDSTPLLTTFDIVDNSVHFSADSLLAP